MPDETSNGTELGYSRIPNGLLEILLPILGEAELKIALFVSRKTHGWHKESDDLSLSQFEEGTGLSRPAVVSGIASLVKRGVLIKTARGNNRPCNYRLVIPTSKPALPDETSKETQLDATSKATLPQLVKQVNPQKKRNKSLKQTEKEHIAADAAAPTKPSTRSPKQERQDRILEEMILDCTGWTFQEFKARMGNAFDKALGAYRPYVKNIDEAGDPEPWLVMAQKYRPGCWWYTDQAGTANFSGQQGRRPTPAGLWKSWKAWEINQPGPSLKVVNGNGHANAPPPPYQPAADEPPADFGRLKDAMLKGLQESRRVQH